MPVIELSKDYLLNMDDKKIRVQIPERILKKINKTKKKKSELMALQGSLKNWDINPVEYQRNIRGEWER